MDFASDRIAIGERKDLSADLLLKHGITGVLNLAIKVDPPPKTMLGVEYNKISLNDNDQNRVQTIHAALLMIDELLDRHIRSW